MMQNPNFLGCLCSRMLYVINFLVSMCLLYFSIVIMADENNETKEVKDEQEVSWVFFVYILIISIKLKLDFVFFFAWLVWLLGVNCLAILNHSLIQPKRRGRKSSLSILSRTQQSHKRNILIHCLVCWSQSMCCYRFDFARIL